MEHLTPQQCSDVVGGLLSEADERAARAHAEECPTCGPRLLHAETQRAGGETGELSTASLDGKRHAEPVLERGTQVGRYVILDAVGQGGMGVVYAAFDPELDRRIALKLLKAADVSEEGKSRLMREAQAMARLAHPNVVPVYDAGVHLGRIYVAMEFVAGDTLKDWLKTRHGWREVVKVFTEAGRGLAAAHAAHLVHRDFKPANVLMGADGRVRVTDFGLARAEGTASGAEPPSAEEPRSPASLSDPLTQVGSVVGTVGYMAPEQVKLAPLDARTDQFSFCVCLWEALYGQRPFVGDTAAAVTRQLLEGALPEPPRGSGVPKRLHALLVRGLKTAPPERFPSMDALLDELQRDPGATVRRASPWLLASAVVAVGIGGFRFERSQAAQQCLRAGDALAGVWDEAVKAKTKSAFEATAKPFAAQTFDSSARALDAWAKAYVDGRTAACEATRVEGRQSEEALQLREACYERKLQELKVVSQVLAEADPFTVERSVTVVYGLSPLSACDDVQQLRAALGREAGEDAEARALRETVLRGKALIDAGQYPKARELLEPAVAKAKDSKRPGLRAQAEWLLGTLFQQTAKFPDALQHLQTAFSVAIGAGLDEEATHAAISAVAVTGVLERPGESRLWLDLSKALVDRLGGDPRLEVELLRAEGISLATSGRPADAAQVQDQGLEAAVKLFGEGSPLLWKSYFELGASYVGAREWVKAVPMLERALDIKEKTQGPDHPEVALVLSNLGTSYFFSGQPAKSRAAFERALDIRERLLGAESPRLVPLLGNLGDTLAKAGDVEAGRPFMQRAVALGEKTLGPKHAFVVAARISLAEAELSVGHLPEAEAQIDAVLALEVPPVYRAEAFAVKSTLTLREGKAKEARGFAQDGVKAAEAVGKESAELMLPLTALGEALLALKLEKEALPQLERALAVAEATKAWPVHKADVQFPLARALLATGGDASRALALAAEAQAAWSTTPARAAELKTLEAWKLAAR